MYKKYKYVFFIQCIQTFIHMCICVYLLTISFLYLFFNNIAQKRARKGSKMQK